MMEKESLTTAMKTSISEVLEKMFFLPLEFSDAVNPGEIWDLEKAEITVSKLNFEGPFSGYFLLFIPGYLALSLTASFMGSNEESVSQDHVTETVKEIINMIAGNTFNIFDDQAIFNLGIPELVPFDGSGRGSSDSEEEIFIGIKTLEDRLALRMVISP